MDCIFRVQSQGHAHRFVLYHQHFPHVYPAGFGAEAIEIGPRTDKEGPCLVLFRNVQASPEAVNLWAQQTILKSSLGRILWVSNSAASQAATQEELLPKLAKLCDGMEGVVRLQCEPRSLEVWLGEHLPGDIQLRKAGANHVINVLWHEGMYRYAPQPAAQFWQNSPTKGQRVADQLSKAAGKLAEAVAVAGKGISLGGVAIDLGAAPGGWTAYLAQHAQRVIAIDPAELDPRALLPNVTHLRCKAEAALPQLEGTWGVGGGSPCACSPSGPRAMGCSQCGTGGRVAAAVHAVEQVGNAESADAVPSGEGRLADPTPGAGCKEPQCNSSVAPAMQHGAAAGAASGGACAAGPAGGVDLVVCDMNHHPADLLPLLRRMLRLLRPGGLAIFTLKFFGIGRDKSQWEEKILQELRQEGFASVRLVWLVANTMSERTCLAWKQGKHAGC